MISLLLPLPGTDESRRNCKGEKPTARTTQRSRAPTKGLDSLTSNRPPPPAARWRGSVRVRRCAMERPPRASGGCRPACRAPEPRDDPRRGQIGPSPQPAPRWSGANLVHPHKAGWPPTAVVARGTGREHRLSSVTVPDQPPGLAPEVLVERMRMPNLRRDGLATPRAAGAQRRVPLRSARAPPRWQEAQPDLTAPNAGAPVGATARWTALAVRLVPRVDRSAVGRERASAVRTACRDPRCTRACH